MMHRLISATAAAIVLSNSAVAAEKMFDRSFDATPGQRLKVEADGGSISVTGTEGQKVVVHIRATGSDDRLEELQLSADRDGEGVSVIAKRKREISGWFTNSPRVEVTIQVPRQYNVDLQSSGGGLKVQRLNGTANGRTSGGSIDLEAIQGTVQMRTSGGSINARGLNGKTELNTSGGAISVDQVQGGLRAHTSGGPIRVERASGVIDVQTSGGSINVGLEGANEGIVAKTSGGGITLRVPGTTKGTLNASTSGGRVSSDLPVTTNESGKSSLRGTINGGGPEILARSSGGSINVVKL
jgi:DUF4097 and DUF4098 domain-containing protein YvlB